MYVVVIVEQTHTHTKTIKNKFIPNPYIYKYRAKSKTKVSSLLFLLHRSREIMERVPNHCNRYIVRVGGEMVVVI